MNLAKIIRKRRLSLGLTQDAVAEAAGISKPYLSNIETGRAKNPPTDTVLESLEQVLQFQPTDLLRVAHLERTPSDIRQDLESTQSELSRLRSVLQDLLEAGGQRLGDGTIDVDQLARKLNLEASPDEPLDEGDRVPIINKVAAGYPQDFTDLDYPPSVAEEYIRCPDVKDPQAFAARVSGDSMSPDYTPGDIVIFSPNTPPRKGQDVFVRFQDGRTTFKRFYLDDERTIRLQPINSVYPARRHGRETITGLWPAVYRIEKLA